ncbi:hypothetical protein [Pseudohalioglobus lutimaris]|uniref:Uncharacterized protein n=1 Tax=Pseudohalioglobus lutimaris TaxID=1737061 RepID=A0A2N5X1S9_9GAMM|nr:hypothetical protein [Pseudohalioglobus lutimaris]PLW68445.1 hypothetical protein C0039_12400 [Pseudohalioglobus lutimaris]
MIGGIPFEVPAQYAAALSNGDIVRAGALLKDTGSGRIVAHLQETGLAQQLLSSATNSPFSPLQALYTPSSVLSNVQLVQIKSMVEGLQVLQFANIGATLAGIGVSAIGFALMNQKLKTIESQLSTFELRVEDLFKEIKERDLRSHYARIYGLFQQADQAHTLTHCAAEWQRIAGALAEESSFFHYEITFLLQQEEFDYDLFSALTRSYAMCNAGRIECLILARELPAARRVSRDAAHDYNTLFDNVTPIELARRSAELLERRDRPYDHLLRNELPKMRTLVSGVRDAQDAAHSKPYLLDTLIENKIDGYEYMLAIREERERPILLLKAS